MTILLRAAHVVVPGGLLEPGWVEVDGRRICAVDVGGPPQAAAALVETDWLAPGFVDMHGHGGGGSAFQAGERDEVLQARRFHLAHGTTTTVASLVTAPLAELARTCSALAEMVRDGILGGIHLEGPFLSSARSGAHDRALLRPPELQAVRRLARACRGVPFMVTLAPELPGGLDAIAEIVDLGGTVAVGHTDADYAVTCRAIASGARVATHLFNGMPPLHHRRPGPVGALLEADGVVIELINDGVHVHPAIVRCVAGAVGTGRVALVTDAIAAAGMDDGEYRLGPVAVRVTAGVARVADGDSLAGSTLTMDAAVRNAVTLGLSPLAAFHAASLTPARALGIADRVGRIEVGLDADLVLLDDRLAVQRVMAKGAWVATS